MMSRSTRDRRDQADDRTTALGRHQLRCIRLRATVVHQDQVIVDEIGAGTGRRRDEHRATDLAHRIGGVERGDPGSGGVFQLDVAGGRSADVELELEEV